MAPTIHREGPFRFFFYSHEAREPPHVHIQREDRTAKVWLQPVSLASSGGFPAQDIQQVLSIVEAQQSIFLESWNEYFAEP